jgi:hypothetical protein
MYENAHLEYRVPNFSDALRTPFLAFIGCVLSIAFGAIAHAQTATGQFNGHVFDGNGAVLVGATITLTNPQSGQSRTVITNSEGLYQYQFPLLSPGHYTITAAQSGFQSAASPDLELEVNQNSTQDFHMQVGATTETVNLSASAELLQAFSTELGNVVEQRTANELPLNRRNFTAEFGGVLGGVVILSPSRAHIPIMERCGSICVTTPLTRLTQGAGNWE